MVNLNKIYILNILEICFYIIKFNFFPEVIHLKITVPSIIKFILIKHQKRSKLRTIYSLDSMMDFDRKGIPCSSLPGQSIQLSVFSP